MNKGIKPCPFCGARDIEFIRGENIARIYCKRCHASSPSIKINPMNAKLDMIDDVWNKRAAHIELYALKKKGSDELYRNGPNILLYKNMLAADNAVTKLKDRKEYMIVKIISDEYIPKDETLGDFKIYSICGEKLGENKGG